jgi:hypothetical protein
MSLNYFENLFDYMNFVFRICKIWKRKDIIKAPSNSNLSFSYFVLPCTQTVSSKLPNRFLIEVSVDLIIVLDFCWLNILRLTTNFGWMSLRSQDLYFIADNALIALRVKTDIQVKVFLSFCLFLCLVFLFHPVPINSFLSVSISYLCAFHSPFQFSHFLLW